MPEKFDQVNVNLTLGDVAMLDQMMSEDGFDNRSAFMRKLVRQEWARRYSRPSELVTVEQTLEAQ